MKKPFFLISVSIFFILCFAVFDQGKIEENNVGYFLTNFGINFQDVYAGNNSGLWWPKIYPQETYIFGSGMGFATLLLTDTTSSTSYYPSSGTTEFVPGDGSDNSFPYDNPFFRVYKSYEIYYPFDSTLSLVDVYSVYNDLDSSYRLIASSKPVRIVVDQYTYNFRAPKMKDMIFIHFRIKNLNNIKLEKSYFTYWADNDIGDDFSNELLGFVENEDLVYQFQLTSETGWHDFPGILSFKLLQGPLATDTVDVYHDGSKLILPYQPICLTQFRNVTINSDPYDHIKRYIFAAGYRLEDFNPSDPESSFEPFPLWGSGIAGYPGNTEDSSAVNDKKFGFSSGPFDLEVGDSTDVSIVVYLTKNPDSIIPLAKLAKWWWNNRNVKYIQFLTPSNLQKISSPTLFSWSGNITFPKYSLHLLNLSNESWLDIEDITSNSYNLDPSTLDDGVYLCGVGGYTDTSFIGDKNHLYVLIDNAGKNGSPYILSFEKSITQDTIINLKWKVLDPDSNLLNNYIYFVNSNGDSIYKGVFDKNDSTFSFNIYKNLPNDSYDIVLISVDDSLCSDTAIDYYVVNFEREVGNLGTVSGDNNTIDLKAVFYDVTKLTNHTYFVKFDYPFIEANILNMPFLVVDSNISTVVLFDTVKTNYYNYSDTYYSKIFDGLGLKITYNNSQNQTADSCKILNDPGYDYPDSLLKLTLSSSGLQHLAGRDMTISWFKRNDSLLVSIIPDGYTDTLIYGDNGFYYYFYSPVSYYLLNTNRKSLYLGGLILWFNYKTLPLSMDTLWLPSDGEVWKVFSSGDRIPIKGDVYRLSEWGISELVKEKVSENNLKIEASIKNDRIDLVLTGKKENVEILLYNIEGRRTDNLYSGSVNGVIRISKKLNLPSGVYFVKEKTIDNVKKIYLIR